MCINQKIEHLVIDAIYMFKLNLCLFLFFWILLWYIVNLLMILQGHQLTKALHTY